MSCTASEYEVEGEFTEALAYDAEGHETEKYEDEEDDPAPDVCCNLCPEAVELRNLLILHLQENHTNLIVTEDNKISIQLLECCDCQEGLELQKNFVNHLIKHYSVQCIKPSDDPVEDLIEHEPLFEVVEQEEPKKKPSYHQKYNRRERSPETEKLQSEFTYDNNLKTFFCNFCNGAYKQKQSVERHLSRSHDTRKRPKSRKPEQDTKAFVCTLCDTGFKSKRNVEVHLEREHKVIIADHQRSPRHKREKWKVKRYCDYCNRDFSYRKTLERHLEAHVNPSNSSIKPLEKIVCTHCTKLVHPRLMNRHNHTHHSKFRPFRCDYPGCTTSYFDSVKLKDHKNIHLGIKPYVCEFCDESFHYASSLSQHKLRHLEPDRYKCEICEQCLATPRSLKLHMRLHTTKPNAPKPFACEYPDCKKSFLFEDRLKNHVMYVHQTDEEFQCEVCDFVTHKRVYLKRHMTSIHNLAKGHPRNRVFPPSNPVTVKRRS